MTAGRVLRPLLGLPGVFARRCGACAALVFCPEFQACPPSRATVDDLRWWSADEQAPGTSTTDDENAADDEEQCPPGWSVLRVHCGVGARREVDLDDLVPGLVVVDPKIVDTVERDGAGLTAGCP